MQSGKRGAREGVTEWSLMMGLVRKVRAGWRNLSWRGGEVRGLLAAAMTSRSDGAGRGDVPGTVQST